MNVVSVFTSSWSRASTVMRCAPGIVGVPTRTPSAGSRRRPRGRRPRSTVQILGATPPIAFSLVRYTRPTLAAGHALRPKSQARGDGDRERVTRRASLDVGRRRGEPIRPRKPRNSSERSDSAQREAGGEVAGRDRPRRLTDASAPRQSHPKRHASFGPRSGRRGGRDPEVVADLEGELLLRPFACAVGRVVLWLAHLDVELEGPDLRRDAAQGAVRRERQLWREQA